MPIKNMLVLSDLSCFGKCSLTVTLPVVSALGIEVSVLPSALLSTHTGGFTGYYYKDLTQDLQSIIKHLNSQNLKFDCIYTGYLSSIRQIDLAVEVINYFKHKDTIIVVDPVMADNGKLYTGFDSSYPQHIIKLCKLANYILPNYTESLFLTQSETLDDAALTKLNSICKNFAITSYISGNLTGVLVSVDDIKNLTYIADEAIDGIFHGAGDLFASAICGCLVLGINFIKACEISKKFVYKCILHTKKAGRDTRYGIIFEKHLMDFAALVKNI